MVLGRTGINKGIGMAPLILARQNVALSELLVAQLFHQSVLRFEIKGLLRLALVDTDQWD